MALRNQRGEHVRERNIEITKLRSNVLLIDDERNAPGIEYTYRAHERVNVLTGPRFLGGRMTARRNEIQAFSGRNERSQPLVKTLAQIIGRAKGQRTSQRLSQVERLEPCL